MLEQIELMRELYPALNLEYYAEMLDNMLGHNYGQVAVFDGTTCLAVAGYWMSTKLWCGKYLELDNVIVSESKRGTGAGKMMQNYLEEKAKAADCNILVLDAYVNNFNAHRFYYNQGFAPKGFHFIKMLPDGKIT